MTYFLILLGLLGTVLAASLYMNWRQSGTNAKLTQQNRIIRAENDAKQAQIEVYANARPGDAGRDLANGSF